MKERVNTGGITTISYPNGYKPPKDEKLEAEIEEGYDQAAKRKKRNKIITWTIIGIILIIVILFLVI